MSNTKTDEAEEDFMAAIILFMLETKRSLSQLNENTDKNTKEIKDSIKDLKTNITSNTNKIANLESKVTKFESKINTVEKNISGDLVNIKKRLDNMEAQAEKAKFPYAEALKSTPKRTILHLLNNMISTPNPHQVRLAHITSHQATQMSRTTFSQKPRRSLALHQSQNLT